MLCKSNTAIQWDFWRRYFHGQKLDQTVSSGLFLSTMISWNTEPQANWKSFNTRLNDLSSLSLSFALEYSNLGLWHSVQVAILATFNAVCADGEKEIPWYRDPFWNDFQLRRDEFFFWVFSLMIVLVAFLIIVRYWITKAFNLFLSPKRKMKRAIITWAFKNVEVISTRSGMST